MQGVWAHETGTDVSDLLLTGIVIAYVLFDAMVFQGPTIEHFFRRSLEIIQ